MAWNSGLQIRVMEGRDQGRVYPLDSQEMTLGRALDPKEFAPGWVLFSEPTVSRVHAILQWNEGRHTYLLQHRSRTNPTLVDGKSVEQHFLQPGQRIQLGLLILGVEAVEVRTGRLGDAVQAPPARRPDLSGPVLEALSNLAEEKAREPLAGMAGMAGPAGLADETPDRGRRQGRSSQGSMRLLVAQGPDKGASFNLQEPVLVIGRRLGPNDVRASAGVLLQDDALPAEQALLVWQDREFTYGILQTDSSPVMTRIRRVISGRPKEIHVGSDLPTLLYEGDVVMMGQSSLVVRKAGPGQESKPDMVEVEVEVQHQPGRRAESESEAPVTWPEVEDRLRAQKASGGQKPVGNTGSRAAEDPRSSRSWRSPGSAELPAGNLPPGHRPSASADAGARPGGASKPPAGNLPPGHRPSASADPGARSSGASKPPAGNLPPGHRPSASADPGSRSSGASKPPAGNLPPGHRPSAPAARPGGAPKPPAGNLPPGHRPSGPAAPAARSGGAATPPPVAGQDTGAKGRSAREAGPIQDNSARRRLPANPEPGRRTRSDKEAGETNPPKRRIRQLPGQPPKPETPATSPARTRSEDRPAQATSAPGPDLKAPEGRIGQAPATGRRIRYTPQEEPKQTAAANRPARGEPDTKAGPAAEASHQERKVAPAQAASRAVIDRREPEGKASPAPVAARQERRVAPEPAASGAGTKPSARSNSEAKSSPVPVTARQDRKAAQAQATSGSVTNRLTHRESEEESGLVSTPAPTGKARRVQASEAAAGAVANRTLHRDSDGTHDGTEADLRPVRRHVVEDHLDDATPVPLPSPRPVEGSMEPVAPPPPVEQILEPVAPPPPVEQIPEPIAPPAPVEQIPEPVAPPAPVPVSRKAEPRKAEPVSPPGPAPTPPEPEVPLVGNVVPRGLPPHVERSLRLGKTPAPPITPPPSEPVSEIPLFESMAFGGTTSAWRHQSDFLVGYEEGSRKGQRVALLGPELSDDRVVTIGAPGERINDIEVDDPEIANDQAILKYRSGRFTLVNSRTEIQVNSLTLGDGDQVVLMTGDRIHLGRTVLVFLERRVVDALKNLALEVVEGGQADLGRIFELNKERLMIGRGRNCDVRLADPEISRIHCVLVHRNGRFYVQHRSDTNPTFINGISMLPGAERQVVVGDRIQVSSLSVLKFRFRN